MYYELTLDDLDLDPDMVKTIQKRAKAKLEKNKEYTCGAVVYSQVLFMKVYDLLSHLANVTSDSVCVYLKLFSVTDANQRRLLRFKMSIILSLILGRPLTRTLQIPPRVYLVVTPMFLRAWRRTS